jgi:hypothetical protein
MSTLSAFLWLLFLYDSARVNSSVCLILSFSSANLASRACLRIWVFLSIISCRSFYNSTLFNRFSTIRFSKSLYVSYGANDVERIESSNAASIDFYCFYINLKIYLENLL